MQKLKKFEEIYSVPEKYLIKSPEGFVPISKVMKTEKYECWYLELENGDSLKGADEHIVYKKVNETETQEVWLKDVCIGDEIKTDTGFHKCIKCDNLGYEDNMYDVEVSTDSHQYYANNIVSHNTTCASIYLLWFAIFNPSKTIAILANKQSTAIGIVDDIKKGYEMLPAWLKPGVKKYDQLEMKFENESRIFARATSPDAIRGESISLLFLDEFAFVAENIAEQFWVANYPTLSCLPKDTMVLTKDGYREIGDYIPINCKKGDYFETKNLSVWGKNGMEDVSHFYVSPDSETKIIETEYGFIHESTLNHPIMTLNNNGVGMVKSKDLKVGDSVRVDLGMNIYGSFKEINYHDNGVYPNNRKYNLNIPSLTNDIMYMLGGYIGEGWVSQNRILISNSDNEFRDVYLNSPHLKFEVIKKSIKLSSDNATYRFFKHLLGDVAEKKCDTKYIPKIVFTVPKELQQQFIAGYIDADGHVNKHGDTTISSTSRKILSGIQLLLINMGIVSIIRRNKIDKSKKIGKYILPQGTVLKSLKDSYILTISRCYAGELKNFGLRIHRKLNRLICVNIKENNKNKQEYIPSNDYVINAIKLSIQESGKNAYWFRRHGVRVEKILNGNTKNIPIDTLQKISNLTGSGYLREFVDNKCVYLRVKNISSGFCDTYDFTCPKTHTFLQNGILGSNTGGNIVVVSTPNGTAGKFYELWKNATSAKNTSWKTMKIPWSAHPDRDESWKETQIQAIGKVKFAQEYSCAFSGSSYTLIDGEVLENMKTIDPPFYPEEGFYVWKKPAPNRIYLVSCDVAKGANTDYHVANVYDATDWHTKQTYEQVALFRRNDISVFDFKDKILEICKKYNNAVVIIENNHLGHTVVHNIYYEDGYDNTWYDYDKGEYGVNASVKTKPLALSYFKDDIETKKMIINSSDMVTELSYFEEVKTGVFQARQGRNFHDDIVASGYWAAYALRSKYWEDHLHFMLSKNVQTAHLNDEQQNDEEVMQTFMKSFGASADLDSEIQHFRDSLGRG